MSIWYYMFLVVLIINIYLVIKIIIIKSEIRNIESKLPQIINTDTNNLITISSEDKDLIHLTNTINQNLQRLRNLELEYINGNVELKESITNISHDLRTPLTAISGYIELIDKNNLSHKEKEYLNLIEAKTRDLVALTEQLFEFTKNIEINKVINKKEVCLNFILENIMGSYYAIFKSNNIEPKIIITKYKIIRSLDESMINRIFDNIISNAIKYSDGDFCLNLDDKGQITISNHATSLDKTSVKKIFNRYFTVENARKKSGIGLSIAKQLVELNNGTINAEYKNKTLVIVVKF